MSKYGFTNDHIVKRAYGLLIRNNAVCLDSRKDGRFYSENILFKFAKQINYMKNYIYILYILILSNF